VLIAFTFMAGMIEGYFFRKLSRFERVILLVVMVALFASHSRTTWSLAGIVAALLITVWLSRSGQAKVP
jgi:TRAP-type uncharacterized transport system fused permease subunit